MNIKLVVCGEEETNSPHLAKVIEENLSDVRVFKVGEVNIDVYIVGRTKQGDWVGLHTKAVET